MAKYASIPLAALAAVVACGGCYSPYYADRGALIGGGVGAATGAIIGEAAANQPLAGAVIGGAAGALTGGVIGAGMDEQEARNRALIEAKLGRRVAAGAVTVNDVVAMSKAGVADDVVINHIRANGMVAAPRSDDLIYLQQQGVSPRVVAAMQEPPTVAVRPASGPVIVREPAPVIIEEHYWGPRPYYYGHHHHHRHWCPPPRRGVSWGVEVHH